MYHLTIMDINEVQIRCSVNVFTFSQTHKNDPNTNVQNKSHLRQSEPYKILCVIHRIAFILFLNALLK